MDDRKLLQQYVQDHSQAAFEQLVRRHLPMIYSTACREVNDTHLANDVAQAVFLVLAQRAERLGQPKSLAAWLFTVTRNAAATSRAKEARRQRHEQQAAQQRPEMQPEQVDEAWQDMEPKLNAVLARLGSKDREAILLRFFEDRSIKEMAEVMEASDAAVKMRLGRALEKLRGLLREQEAVMSVAGLATMLETKARMAVPAELAGSVTAAALGGVAGGTTAASAIAEGVTNMMMWAKIKIVAAMVIGVLALSAISVQITRSALAQGQQQAPAVATGPMQVSTRPIEAGPVATDGRFVEVQKILAAAKNAQARFPKAYRALFWFEDGGSEIDVVYRQEDKVRLSHYFSRSASEALPDVKDLHLTLPATAEQVLQWSQKQTAVEISLGDGQRNYHRRNPVPGFVNEPPGPTIRISRAGPYAENLMPIDSKVEDIQWSFANRGAAAELLPESDETPLGCIGLRFGEKSKRFDYYADPAQDYICRKEVWWEKSGEAWQKRREYRYEDLHQLEQTTAWCIGTVAGEDFGDEAKGLSGHSWIKHINIKVLKDNEYPEGIFDASDLTKNAAVERK